MVIILLQILLHLFSAVLQGIHGAGKKEGKAGGASGTWKQALVDRGLSPREATHGAWGPGKSPEKSQSPGG
jgi:hypothetical protein